MTEIVAEISQHARRSPHVNQRSGVSARLSIANYETLVANAARRALANGEREVVPRVSDLDALAASTSGKIEIETLDDGRDSQVLDRIIKSAVLEVFRARVKPELLGPIVSSFEDGSVVHTGEDVPSAEYQKLLDELDGLKPLLADARRRRVARRRGARHRVRARGPAPHQAPQQGRRGRPGRVPRPRLSPQHGVSLQVLALGRHAGRVRPRRRRAARGDDRRSPLPRRSQRRAAPHDAAGLPATARAATCRACARCSRSCASSRREQLDRYDLGGVYEDIANQLDEIVDEEREGIDRRVDEARAVGRQAPRGAARRARAAAPRRSSSSSRPTSRAGSASSSSTTGWTTPRASTSKS